MPQGWLPQNRVGWTQVRLSQAGFGTFSIAPSLGLRGLLLEYCSDGFKGHPCPSKARLGMIPGLQSTTLSRKLSPDGQVPPLGTLGARLGSLASRMRDKAAGVSRAMEAPGATMPRRDGAVL